MAAYVKSSWFLILLPLSFFGLLGCQKHTQEWPAYEYSDLQCRGWHTALSLSDDDKCLAVSADGASARDNSSIVAIRDGQTTYFTGVMIKTSPRVEQIEFVSNEFGFLLALSIDPDEARQMKWPVLPYSLEQLKLNGERRVVVNSIPHPICSLALSADRKLAAVCMSAVSDPPVAAQCCVYSLEDGKQVSKLEVPNALESKAVFVGNTHNLIVLTNSPYHPERAYLIRAESGEVLQETQLPRDNPIYCLVGSSQVNEVFCSQAGAIFRIVVEWDIFRISEFYKQNLLGGVGIHAKWLAIDSSGMLLAAGESSGGSEERNATQFIDVSTGRLRKPMLEYSGPMRFSSDGKWLYFPSRRVQLNRLSLTVSPPE